MNFLPDVYVTCDVCHGRRYNSETLQVKYKGYSIADLLEATVEDAVPLLENIPQIKAKLQTLHDVGLGYIHLGQSSTTLSGGEAQRIKLARELSKRQTGRTLYILDEPTTGLHFEDVKRLLEVLQRLADLGNTVLVIEHQLDVIKSADWIIDMGPEGGEKGGQVVAAGTPEQILRIKKSHTAQALEKVLRNGKVA
jgi:excinuclease ABC subunit A